MGGRGKGTGQKGRSPYQAVFGELYRRSRVSSCHNIPAGTYADVMAWLTEYHGTVDSQTQGDTP